MATDVETERPQRHPDLGRSHADAVGGRPHGVEKVGSQRPSNVVDDVDLLARSAEDGMREEEDGSDQLQDVCVVGPDMDLDAQRGTQSGQLVDQRLDVG